MDQFLYIKVCDLLQDNGNGEAIKGYGKKVTEVKVCNALAQMIQTTTATSEEDDARPSSTGTKISEHSVDYQEDPDHAFDFWGLKLDRGRLQSYLSSGKKPTLEQQRDSAAHLNTISLHTRMFDNLDETDIETADLSLSCFCSSLFEDSFQRCLEFLAQNRFIGGFHLICGPRNAQEDNERKRERAPRRRSPRGRATRATARPVRTRRPGTSATSASRNYASASTTAPPQVLGRQGTPRARDRAREAAGPGTRARDRPREARTRKGSAQDQEQGQGIGQGRQQD